MGKSLNTEEFIKKSVEIHGNKYDYSCVDYKNSRTNIHIICPEHGDFYQKAGIHLQGHGCPKCAHETTLSFRRLNNDSFIRKAKEIHGDKYDYSKVNYVNSKTKVCIICPEHGEFWMKPNDHLSRKYGCHKCGWEKEGLNARKTTEEFIKKAQEKYGDKFDYSKVKYVKNKEKVCIISNEIDKYGVKVGEFWQTPSNHLLFGQTPNKIQMTTKKFIERAKKVHGNFYDYSKVFYKNTTTKVIITCPIHGDFEQLPYAHLAGKGCHKCHNKSVLEKRTRNTLLELNINFTEQQRFDFLGKKSLDFYVPEKKIAIECQGRQHFIESTMWENLETITQRDIEKKCSCEDNGIELFYVVNKQYKNLNKNLYTGNNLIYINDLKMFLENKLSLNKKEDEK